MMMTSIALSGAALAALNIDTSPRERRRLEKRLKHLDEAYQSLIRRNVDPLFGGEQRMRQLAEFNDGLNHSEASLNRSLGGAVIVAGAAGVGALGVPTLSLLSGVCSVALLAPMVWAYLKQSWRERKLKYALFPPATEVLALAGGYYFFVSMMTLVYLISMKIASRTQAVAQDSMRSAFTLQPPQKVWVLTEGVEVEMAFEELQLGDVIVISGGQMAPVDGVIVSGEGTVDQHVLTGESRPIEKTIGDPVFANTFVVGGKLFIEVEKTGGETAASKIASMLATASTSSLETRDRSERFMDGMTYPLLAIGGAAWGVVGASNALAIFNGGFASAALTCGPLCMLSYLNVASRQGILIKDGRSLERLKDLDAIVFDKTGTLTQEQPCVSALYAAPSWSREAVLRFAAIAEHRQTHPIARAILAEAEVQGLDLTPPGEAIYTVGMGIAVKVGETEILVGGARFMKSHAVAEPQEAEDWRAYADAVGGSLVFVSVDGQCIGAAQLEAQLRPEAEDLVHALQERGIKTYILSGDGDKPTSHLARELKVDGYFAEVSPKDKAQTISRLQAEGHTVCFVGDGVNDALALNQADVSISMRGASTLATDSAQIIMMSPSLSPMLDLMEIGEDFDRNLTRTMALGYLPGGVLVCGVFLFGFGLPAALIAYSASLGGTIASALDPAINPSRKNKETSCRKGSKKMSLIRNGGA